MDQFIKSNKNIIFSAIILFYIFVTFFIFTVSIFNHKPHVVGDNCNYTLGSMSFCQNNVFSYVDIWKEITTFSIDNLYEIILFLFLTILLFVSKLVDEIRTFSNFNSKYKFSNFLVVKWAVNTRAP